MGAPFISLARILLEDKQPQYVRNIILGNKESHNFLIDNNLGCPTKLIYLYVALVLWNSTLIIIRNYIYIYLLCFTTIYVKFIKTNSCNMKIFVLFYYVICQRNYAHYFKFIGLVRSSLRRVIKTQEEHKQRLGE